MNSYESVTDWLAELKAGQTDAAQKIWERYFQQLIDIARNKFGSTSKRSTDEEDVVVQVMENLWFGVQNGRFPKLNDRNDLWQILVMLTDRRATDAIRRSTVRYKHEAGESALAGRQLPANEQRAMNFVEDETPSAEFAIEMVENLKQTFIKLEDETLQQVLVWKLEGYTNAEIAEKLKCVERTVERKLNLIRQRIVDE